MATGSSKCDMQGRMASTGMEDKQQPFPLFDLPPELWIRCCQYDVVVSEPIILQAPDDQAGVQALVAQPAITRTCGAIRAETIALFYQSNEFRFIDDGECTLRGLRKWAEALWSSHWPLVQKCTIESQHEDIIEHMCSEFSGFAEVEFDDDAPEDEVTKMLKFSAKALPDARTKVGAKDAEVGKKKKMATASDGSKHHLGADL